MAYINGKNVLFSARVVQTIGGITPVGTRSIKENGIYDVTNYASVEVDVAGGGSCNGDHIIKVSTEAEMTSLLSTAEVGSVYKYTGTSTDTYENGALYIVEAVSE